MTKGQLLRFKKQIINLYKSPPLVRRHILRNASDSFVKILAESALNILRNNIALNRREKNKLSKHKSIIRKLASRKVNLRTKRTILQARGGFLISFLKPIVKVLSQLF